VTSAVRLAGPVLVGPDDERERAWVVGGRITYDEPNGTPTDVQTLDGWVLPGLVDAHCHLGLGPKGAVDDATTEQQALADRAAGALLLRDAGSPVDTRWVQEREDLPRLVRAGRHLARPKRYLRGFAHEIEPEELASYVVNEARSGDGWVKLVGDWIDREAGDLTPCWPRWALDEAIAAAHDNGARVTAHCFGEESIQDLVEAGIDCIEHGTGLTAETIPLLARRGVPIVPTLVNIANFPAIADEGEKRFPAYAERMRRLYERRHETVAHAHDAGIPVFVGTDAGGSLPHGLVAREVAELMSSGLTAVDALDAACWSARRWLGWPGLEEGAEADLVVYPVDPRVDPSVLAAPSAIVLRGRLH
jgi:imidazolonepropionase-like amidohydrolase